MNNSSGKYRNSIQNRGVNGRLLSVKDAAAWLGISQWALRERIWAGDLPIVRWQRKQMIDIGDLEKLIDRYKTTYE